LIYDPVLTIGLIIVGGFIGGALAAAIQLPRITGYIVAGMLLSPSISNLISKSTIDNLSPFITVSLSIIGYSIGGSLYLGLIKQAWKSIFWITLLQGLFAWLLSTLGIMLLAPLVLTIPNATFQGTYFPMAFVLGAIAWATAPAVTIAIIHECKAKGTLVATILSVVALTDILAVIALSLAIGISLPLTNGQTSFSAVQNFSLPLVRISGAIGVGLAGSLFLVLAGKVIKEKEILLVAILGIIIFCTGIAEFLEISSVLASMVAGFVTVNAARREEMFLGIEGIENVIFVVFFAVSGMNFDFHTMVAAGFLTVVVESTRCFGKWLGAFAGARISGAGDIVEKYIGFPLLPKAGLTIGLALVARNAFPHLGDIMFNVLLASTIINMLFTPPLAKYTVAKFCRG